MGRPWVGKILRANPLSSRVLTHLRILQLSRAASTAEFRLFASYAKSGTFAIDVGASVGNFAFVAARRVGRRGRVLALEPNPEVYRELVNTTWGTSVTALNLAASDARGVATLAVPPGADGSPSPPLGRLDQPYSTEDAHYEVRTILLDDLVPPWAQVSAIKIDVEGHERAVVRGARETIERCHPVLIVEIERRHLSADSGVQETVSDLLGRGYQAWGIHGDDLIPWREFDAERHQTAWLEAKARGETPEGYYVNNFLFLPFRRGVD